MTKNMGTADKSIRLIVAAVLLILAFGTGVLGAGLLKWLAVIVAVVFALTSFVSFCPLYRIVGLKTCSDC